MQPTLLSTMTVRAPSRGLQTVERVAAVVFVTILTAVAAQVSVPLPFTPVPFTFQPMVVLVGAAAPALAHGAGRLLGPTGGYLMSYPLAAYVAGTLAERGFDRRYLTAVVAMVCGLGVIFAGGVFWLAAFVQARGLGAALAEGFYPFIVADFVKLLLAAGVMPSLWWLARARDR
jgi:biotin transport system substrate-specific component